MYTKIVENYEKCKRKLKRVYFVYELETQICMCEPWEKVFCNVLLGLSCTLILYATFALLQYVLQI